MAQNQDMVMYRKVIFRQFSIRLAAIFGAIALAGIAGASENLPERKYIFLNPCERGPLPKVKIINHRHQRFVREMMAYYPDIKRQNAEFIAHQLCDDLTIVGDDAALTERFKLLVAEYGELGENPNVAGVATLTESSRQALPEASGAPKVITAAAPTVSASSTTPQTPSVQALAPRGPQVLQLGMFSIESNADRIVAAMNAQGLGGQKSVVTSGGRIFWRAVATNVGSAAALEDAKRVAQSFGITDAFLTAN